jgi:hypothetical protein
VIIYLLCLRKANTLSINTHDIMSTSLFVCLSIYLPIYGTTALWDLGPFFSFSVLYTVGRTPWTGDQPVARPLSTHRTTQTQNKSTKTYTNMPREGFEPVIPAFQLVKTVHALDRAAFHTSILNIVIDG